MADINEVQEIALRETEPDCQFHALYKRRKIILTACASAEIYACVAETTKIEKTEVA